MRWNSSSVYFKKISAALATGVPSCEKPGSAHEQTCQISREELPHPIKQRRDELRKRYFFVSLPLWWSLLILVDSCAEWGCPDTLGFIQGASYLAIDKISLHGSKISKKKMFNHAPKVHSVFWKCVKEANILPTSSSHCSGASTVASAYSATGVFLLA